MSEISETIDAVPEPLRPVMKQHGFAKSGRTWRRRREGCVQIVNVQASTSNSDERGLSGPCSMESGQADPQVEGMQ